MLEAFIDFECEVSVIAARGMAGAFVDYRLVENRHSRHNSGHFSFDACITSQFEQQLCAVCGLPLGTTAQMRPAVMASLLGDLWGDGEPGWPAALTCPGVKRHLYTALADNVALETALAARSALTSK